MTQPTSKEPQSPCVGICRLDRQGVCLGCGRQLDEIAQWPQAGNIRKRAIIEAARKRLSAMRAAGSRDRKR